MKRAEHPNPQWKRLNYLMLNGEWDFEIDNGLTGYSRDLVNNKLSGKIEVPFCPESDLSGVAYTDFIKACWYKKRFIYEKKKEKRVFLHFGAVDYECKVYLNGKLTGRHAGGYTPFSFEVTNNLIIGENEITVYAMDDIFANVPSGKQSNRRESFGCFYTRVTGIWQPVYLELIYDECYIKSARYFPNINSPSVGIEVVADGEGLLSAEVFYKGKPVGKADTQIVRKGMLHVELSETHLWEPGKGNLYDVVLRLGNDEVLSYFGLREAAYDGRKFTVNGKPVFQRFVLDQGYYPGGVYTPEYAEAYIDDIKKAMALGFNGARLHQKVFEPVYLYHCDRLGFLVWGEMPDWGMDHTDLSAVGNFINEWREAVERDFNHPSIITWSPLNEAWEDLADNKKIRDARFVEAVYDFTKTLDPTRPCVDVSGGYHGKRTDVFDFHCYNNAEMLQKWVAALERDDLLIMPQLYSPADNIRYKPGTPTCASEYGGMAYSSAKEISDGHSQQGNAWGYTKYTDENVFVNEYLARTDCLLNCVKLSGFCYTQLYDVEQEQNGLYTFNRQDKLSGAAMQSINKCNRRTAAIEAIPVKDNS